MSEAATILLTGLPRSGTTLTCSLLNECPDVVALAEPIQLERHGDRERAVEEIAAFADAMRRRALDEGVIVSKHVNGVISDNFAEPPSAGSATRKVLAMHGDVPVGKRLSADFQLFIKHPAEFTALADLLKRRFKLFALVRNPLAVLAAWQTVEMPVGRGHMPAAEAFAPDLAARQAAIPDRLERQVALMEWLLGVYARLPPECVIRYEDMTADPLETLLRLTPQAQRPQRLLSAHDPSQRYQGVDLKALANALSRIAPLIREFYPEFEV
jgi:Sulfotransferase family